MCGKVRTAVVSRRILEEDSVVVDAD